MRAWVTSLVALRTGHLDAPALPVKGDAPAQVLRALLTPSPRRRASAPVGSDAWLRLLGEGGIEDLDEVLA